MFAIKYLQHFQPGVFMFFFFFKKISVNNTAVDFLELPIFLQHKSAYIMLMPQRYS